MPRRREYADPAARQQAYRRRQAHPTPRHVRASQTPGRYVWDLDALLQEVSYGCV